MSKESRFAMKQVFMKKIILFTGFYCLPLMASLAQGDFALYDTYTRFEKAVFSVNVEIPQEHIMQRYEEQVNKIREYQESLITALTGQSSNNISIQQFEIILANLERQLTALREHLLVNNRIKGAAFAVDEHHLVTISTVVKSATLGGGIKIENHVMRDVPAKLLNYDPSNGVAVLRVDDVTFEQTVKLDNYQNMLPEASYIMSIQRPYNLPSTPVSGVIGGYYRKIGLFEIEKYIQSDLPLYPGNEGAPVFSPSGQLIGMIATEYHIGQSPGVTFVIPSEYITESAQEIIEKGSVERGIIPGVQIDLQDRGVVIDIVDPNSPYIQSLHKGDVILEINGQDSSSFVEVFEILHNSKPGTTLVLKVKRDSLLIDVPIEVYAGTRNMKE